jgi:putative nucleotidyltransferase with HDIG domain
VIEPAEASAVKHVQGFKMGSRARPDILRRVLRIRPDLALLVVFLLLLGLINCLLVGQRVVLYLFYVPVVLAAWFMAKRQAVGVALLAAMLVVAYAFFVPDKLAGPPRGPLVWADLAIWGGILVVTAYMVSTLRSRTEEALRNLQRAYAGVLSILSKFIKVVDADTEAHCVRVSAWAVRITEALGLGASVVEEARIAGLLHDVGKVDVSVDLLRKAAALSEGERSAIQAHPTQGAALVKPVGGLLAKVADAIEYHHEKMDGSGYKGVKGQDIPLLARIIAVADAFDAVISDRPYRKGAGIFEAVDIMAAAAGTHFDPEAVAALKRIVAEEGESVIAYAGGEAYAK